jgi:hypothetical protein
MELLCRLPIEIIREHIIPYTYEKQPEFIVEDIRDFILFRKSICTLYKTAYPEERTVVIMRRIADDISRIMNQNIPVQYGYTDKYYEYWRRLPYLTDKSEMFIYDSTMELSYSITIFSKVNILIGLMTIEEREKVLMLSRVS